MGEILWHVAEVIDATGGECANGNTWQATGFAMDSREVKKGDLFIALKGDAATTKYTSSGHDGHDYVAAAYTNGAVAAIVDHLIDVDIPQIIVPDTFQAFQNLARLSRTRPSLRQAIAITGSVGKTGTRDMVKSAFDGADVCVHASIKSYNNAIGVPYTLATMPASTEVGIFEVGMNFAGEISPLSHLIKPTMAIITAIAEVHIENFNNGINGIVNAKSEIFDGINANGIALLPRDNPHYDELVANARESGIKHIYSFGEHPESDARLTTSTANADYTHIKATIMGEDVSYHLNIAGKHIAINSLSALLAVKLADLNIQDAAKALETIHPIEGRGARQKLYWGDRNNPVILIDESYNASPVAVKAALQVLAMMNPTGNGRRIAVLGDMRELGKRSQELHENLAQPLQESNVDLVYTCGENMESLYRKIPEHMQGATTATSDELAAIIVSTLQPGDIVLVKGSLGTKMKVIVDSLREGHLEG
tara:strand:- start:946 stop:2388 length:1443 start_codon:yes stop_codon:yes gene_type:complete